MTANPYFTWPKPIPVSERLPELCDDGEPPRVIAYCTFAAYCNSPQNNELESPTWLSGYFEPGKVEFVTDSDVLQGPELTITHWLPLPPNPEGTQS